jgi:hypothetical protein
MPKVGFSRSGGREKGPGGHLFGIRPTLEDRGLDFSGHWSSVYAAAARGGLQRRGAFVEQVRFELEVDFAKLTGWDAVEGLTGYASVRWRRAPLETIQDRRARSHSPQSVRRTGLCTRAYANLGFCVSEGVFSCFSRRRLHSFREPTLLSL